MNYYLAPMEGITTYIYRNAFAKYFGGIDRYFTPFLASMKLNHREKMDVAPENNEGITLIPQILTNHAEEFLAIADALQKYGYKEVNLNLGCPSGTVVSKHRGSGFLAVLQELEQFLDKIFEKCPVKISIKTRIGISDEAEWDNILQVYKKYPVSELIVHTRLQKDFYKKPTHPETILKAEAKLDVPICYNGDINSVENLSSIKDLVPDMDRVMLGRGLIADPNLIRRLCGEEPVDKDTVGAFVDTLLADYSTKMAGGERVILYKLKEVWGYLGNSFTNSERYLKKIRKASSILDYEVAVNNLLREQELLEK